MLWFWIFSIALSMLIFALRLQLQINKTASSIRDKNLAYKRFKIALVKHLLFSCFLILFIPTVIPLIIWNTGAKETQVVDKIEERDSLSSLPGQGKDYYLGQRTEDGKNLYIVNSGSVDKPLFDSFDTTIAEITHVNDTTPTYDKINQYKINQLKGTNFICNAVNEMYANIYLRYRDKDVKYVGEKIKVYLPNSNIASGYKGDIHFDSLKP